jgi:F-type H+-transporting ATPase subunit delta
MASVTSRYARAFADVVFDLKLDANQTVQQVRTLVDAVNASVELRRIWENPSIPAEQKRNLLDAIVARIGASRPVRNFVAVLIDNRRIAALADIARQFELELDHRLGFTEAQISSARELAPDEKHELESRIEKLSGKKVRAHYATDRALLGGAVVKLGSTIYDGSVKGQLEKLKQELSS